MEATRSLSVSTISLPAPVQCSRTSSWFERLFKRNSSTTPSQQSPNEHTIENEEKNIIYPPSRKYRFVYDSWLTQQPSFSHLNQFDVSRDFERFSNANQAIQTILLKCFAIMLYGKTCVLRRYKSINTIKTPTISTFIGLQMSLNAVHLHELSKMMAVSFEPEYFRGHKFVHEYMQDFMVYELQYRNMPANIQLDMFRIMLFNRILFPTILFILHHGRELDIIPTIYQINEIIANNNDIEYDVMRHLLSRCERKLDLTAALEAMYEFVAISRNLLVDTIGYYMSNDRTFNRKCVLKCFQRNVHRFRSDNELYETPELQSEHELRYHIEEEA